MWTVDCLGSEPFSRVGARSQWKDPYVLVPEECIQIPTAMGDTEDQYIFIFDAINDNVFPQGKTPRSRPEIIVA
jgi:hypothetical protein